jgi:hypothetical protein
VLSLIATSASMMMSMSMAVTVIMSMSMRSLAARTTGTRIASRLERLGEAVQLTRSQNCGVGKYTL